MSHAFSGNSRLRSGADDAGEDTSKTGQAHRLSLGSYMMLGFMFPDLGLLCF